MVPICNGMTTYGKLSSQWMLVTPALASEWLDKNYNRKLYLRAVAAMSKAILSGQWQVIHQGIAFIGDFKRLVDGQHRLKAIVDSAVAQVMLVTTGFTEKSILAMDDHTRRTVADMQILVYKDASSSSGKITSAARAMYLGAGTFKKLSRQDAGEFIQAHNEALKAIIGYYTVTTNGLSRAPVLAALARAWEFYPKTEHKKLKYVMRVLCDTKNSKGRKDGVLHDLRSELLEFAIHKASGAGFGGAGGGGNGAWSQGNQMYRLTVGGIRAYMTGSKKLTAIEPPDDFPLKG